MKSFASTKDAGKFERNVDKEFPDKRAFAYEEGNVMVDENSRVTCFYCRKVLAITCFGSHFTRFCKPCMEAKEINFEEVRKSERKRRSLTSKRKREDFEYCKRQAQKRFERTFKKDLELKINSIPSEPRWFDNVDIPRHHYFNIPEELIEEVGKDALKECFVMLQPEIRRSFDKFKNYFSRKTCGQTQKKIVLK